LEGLATENLGIFYYHLVYFTVTGNILWPFCIFCGHFVYFPRFGILYQENCLGRLTDFLSALPRPLGHLGQLPLADGLPELAAEVVDAVHVALFVAALAAPLALPGTLRGVFSNMSFPLGLKFSP
jgi:hypothetical protein